MMRVTVRRTGKSLVLPIPPGIVREMGLPAGDEVFVRLERVPQWMALAGSRNGKITAAEFTRLSNKGEALG
jgi:antitoxin component of MazEF toxin-antitoxin module